MPGADWATALPALHAHGMDALQCIRDHPTCTALRTTWPLCTWAEPFHHGDSIALSGVKGHISPWQAEDFAAYEEEQQRAAAAAEAEAQRRLVCVPLLADEYSIMITCLSCCTAMVPGKDTRRSL